MAASSVDAPAAAAPRRCDYATRFRASATLAILCEDAL